MDTNEILTAILDEQKAMRDDQSAMKDEFKAMRDDQEAMKDEFKAMRDDQSAMKDEFRAMRDDQIAMKEDFKAMRDDQSVMKDEFKVMRIDQIAMKDELMSQGQHLNSIDKELGLLTSQTNSAVKLLENKLNHMNDKLDKNIVVKYEFDFISEKIHYLEKEIFKLKQQ